MPRHDFECGLCETLVEIDLKVSEFEDVQFCAKCNQKMIRIVGQSTFKLKGRGWSPDGYMGGKQLAMSGVRKNRIRG